MNTIIPVFAVTLIGIICGIMLVIATKLMEVPEDEVFVAIREHLPGANCGACGYAGCDGYAHALSNKEIVDCGKCIPGGSSVATQIASVLGLDAQDVSKKVAYIACCGDSSCTGKRYLYQGIQSCAASKMLFGGDGTCSYGCLGRGDCASVCPKHAISVKKTLASVDITQCIGCGLCAQVCPNQLIHIIPISVGPIVRCSNQDKGAVTRKVCSVGCIGCKKCERVCPVSAITVTNNCAHIDHNKCTYCGQCLDACVSGCIKGLLTTENNC